MHFLTKEKTAGQCFLMYRKDLPDMQIAPTPTTVTRRQLCKTIFYATPEGQLVAVLGNAHMLVSPEEATACFQRILDSTALYQQLIAPERITGDLVASHSRRS
jgi:hypothetical protein